GPYAMPDNPFDIQNVAGSRLGQYWPNRYLCEPTSVVTIVSGGITDASACTISPGHIVPADSIRSIRRRARRSRNSLNGAGQDRGGACSTSASRSAAWSTSTVPDGTIPPAFGDSSTQ